MIRQLRARAIPSVAACFVILLSASGCWQPTMAKVSGTVTWQGKPVSDAIVQFVHKNRPGAAGRTDAAGRFSLTTLKPGDGAYFGSFRVAIEPFVPGLDPDPPAAPPRTPPPPLPSRKDIPQVYRSPETSPLSVEVVQGFANQFDFELAK
jgi:hypothetical protein